MIGVFDSGVGGLTVVNAIKKKHPNLSIIYFGDTARVPWGEKSPETVREYSRQICEFLIQKNVKKIVIACNTASSLASDYLRKEFPQIEFFDVISPTLKKIQNGGMRNVLVIGTKAVARSRTYEKKLADQQGFNIKTIACPLFVPLVEEGWHEEAFTKQIARKYLFPALTANKPEVLVLGCTHYPLLRKTIQSVIGDGIMIIDSATPVADEIEGDESVNEQDQYFFSDLSLHYRKLITLILGKKIKPKQIKL